MSTTTISPVEQMRDSELSSAAKQTTVAPSATCTEASASSPRLISSAVPVRAQTKTESTEQAIAQISPSSTRSVVHPSRRKDRIARQLPSLDRPASCE